MNQIQLRCKILSNLIDGGIRLCVAVPSHGDLSSYRIFSESLKSGRWFPEKLDKAPKAVRVGFHEEQNKLIEWLDRSS